MRTLPALSLLLAAGCVSESPHDTADLPPWSDHFPNAVTTDTTGTTKPDETELNLSVPDDVTWPWKMRRWDSVTGTVYSEPCDIDLKGVQAASPVIEDCLLDQNEGDLFYSGMNIFLHVPPNYCDYLFVGLYSYQAYAVGTGPAAVEFTVHADGSIDDFDTDGDGIADSSGGVPTCAYNYGYPNCCIGNYTQTIHDEVSGKDLVSSETWGGFDDLGDCFDGGAYLYKGAQFATNGLPYAPYFYLDQNGLDEEFQFYAPAGTEHPLGDLYSTNVPLSNFHMLSDSNGVLPASLDGSNLPGGVLNQSETDSYVQPTYDFICADNAKEYLGIIHLSVREWNLESEFEKKQPDGDPDAGTGEFSPDPPFEPLDDKIDWKEWPPETYIGGSD
jgi:hypothetical protein